MTTHTGGADAAHADAAPAAFVDDQLPGAELPEVPRRFAIFTYDADDEPELYLWGIQTARRALAFHHTGTSIHRATTADAIRDRVDLIMDTSLVWLDPNPSDRDPSDRDSSDRDPSDPRPAALPAASTRGNSDQPAHGRGRDNAPTGPNPGAPAKV